jgi:hypothetical protein
VHGLVNGDLREAARALREHERKRFGRASIAVAAGCRLIMLFATRLSRKQQTGEIESLKEDMLKQSHVFAKLSRMARPRIAEHGESFIREESVSAVLF